MEIETLEEIAERLGWSAERLAAAQATIKLANRLE